MKKNNKGITLITLVLTVIVIFILASIAIPTGNDLIIKTRMNRYIAIMYLMKIEAEKIYENYEFDNENADLTVNSTAAEIVDISGTMNLLPNEEKSLVVSSGTWYKWNKNTLDYLNIDSSKIIKNEDDEFFCVNYETGEVLYNNGVVINTNQDIRYTLTGLIDYENE